MALDPDALQFMLATSIVDTRLRLACGRHHGANRGSAAAARPSSSGRTSSSHRSTTGASGTAITTLLVASSSDRAASKRHPDRGRRCSTSALRSGTQAPCDCRRARSRPCHRRPATSSCAARVISEHVPPGPSRWGRTGDRSSAWLDAMPATMRIEADRAARRRDGRGSMHFLGRHEEGRQHSQPPSGHRPAPADAGRG